MTAKIQFTRTHNTLANLGDIFVYKLKAQMKFDGTDATGKTARSISKEVKETTLYILSEGKGSAATLELIDKGFRPKTPPPKDDIIKWMKAKGVSPKRKGKFVRATNSAYKRSATAIAIGISRSGAIKRFANKGSGILNYVFNNQMEPHFTRMTLGAYAEDIEEYLNNNTKRVVK